MTQEKFHAVLTLLVPAVIQRICEQTGAAEIESAKAFFASDVYALLEDEETKLWHFSAPAIADMFAQERETGRFEIPEGV